MHPFGFEADIQATEVLFASLRLRMLDGADRADRLHRPVGEDARAYKRSWMLGFIREVTARIGAAQTAARAAAEQGGAMDGRGARAAGAWRWFWPTGRRWSRRALPPSTRSWPRTRPTTFKGTGYWQGVADGRDADIGGPAFDEEAEAAQLIH
ncbi:hypothetical protein [Streptomyces sp. NPDC005486]|uniref:hypothetical protein n=1 Tax=Streptomyces sp. NPDC005486 TaxID=3155345 RepID=UPI0033AD7B46